MIFTEAPIDFEKKMDVVGCYLQHDGKFVLLHRPAHKSSGNKWGVPAGKVDPGESIHEAMRRELFEETSVTVAPEDLRHFRSVFVRDEHGAKDIAYHMFSTVFLVLPTIVISPHEHQAFRWATPSEALTMDLVHDLDECIRMYYH